MCLSSAEMLQPTVYGGQLTILCTCSSSHSLAPFLKGCCYFWHIFRNLYRTSHSSQQQLAMTTQLFLNSVLFTIQLFKMEKVYTLFCSITLVILLPECSI